MSKDMSINDCLELGIVKTNEKAHGLGAHEADFLDRASEYIASNSDNTNKLEAWKCLKDLREITKQPSAKEAILSVVNSGQYPSNVAEFRNKNFATIELGYKYLGSIEPDSAESTETVSASEPQAQSAPNTNTTMQQAVIEQKMVRPFSVDKGAVSIEQLQKKITGNAASSDGITSKLNGAVEKLTTPEMIDNIEKSLVPIIDMISANPNTVVNLLNGLSALLATPAPQQGQPNIQVQTCECGHQH